ncbi:peptide synthetase [Paraburkholderia tropica]|uniref:peptide synthetase n=1 Tax=Paraburkholderia tropica TaxID=92647 RepID=UPI0007ED5D80|nr:peptide synthetase [Paraburkholderia tropica]OBR47789.1 peptide synthetase [Paraburkholderia tropica]
MVNESSPLFDFSSFLSGHAEYIGLIREFASAHPFRSAAVEELELDEDFYRRPLRPEDLEFLQFKKPVAAERVSRLPALATQRLLMAINEVGVARFPKDVDAAEFARFDAFYSSANQVLGARIRPFLENYGFTFLGNEAQRSETAADYARRFRGVIEQEERFWGDMFALLLRNNYLLEGLRFIMIQRWCLAPSRRVAVERAAASGYFDCVPAADRPDVASASTDPLLARVAEFVGVTRREHSYWQFYLPTSMAKCNLLYALGSRPDRAFALLGASFVAEAEAVAFATALAKACPHLVMPGGAPDDGEAARTELIARFSRALAQVEHRFGREGIFRAGQGFGAGEKMAERARWDLGEQLKWLSAIDRFVEFAEKIDKRIAAECPGIDRETFVEPRDMCSTTHVHNDHRLVVIRSHVSGGAIQMHFWGNLGMRHEMKEGDKVLIPDGRLHGSTVVCEECTYDQPIIPEEWIAELMEEVSAPVSAAA